MNKAQVCLIHFHIIDSFIEQRYILKELVAGTKDINLYSFLDQHKLQPMLIKYLFFIRHIPVQHRITVAGL